jgi:outer membrane protein
MRISRFVGALTSAALGLATVATPSRAENLLQAWDIALSVNQNLQSQRAQSVAQGLNLAAAKSARLPTVRTLNIESFLTATPKVKNTFLSTPATGGSAGGLAGSPGTPGLASPGVPLVNTSPLAGLPSTFPVLGPGQRQIPLSLTFATVPLYTGGRISRNIEAAGAQVGAQRTEEFRTALDLKVTVADAYIGVLRAQKNLEVARSNVAQLGSFARDTRNRREEGLAIRSDELAAEVSLANARLTEIQARTRLESAWATYNRYLCRPLTTVVPLEELTTLSPNADWKELAEQAVRVGAGDVPMNDGEVRDLTERAIRIRPELAGLAEQARALGAQAEATRAGLKPQASFIVSSAFVGNNNQVPQEIGAATFLVDWMITDGGATRRRAASQRQQEFATLKRRADAAADVALEVRTRWLDLQQSRQRVPVARLAIAQADENTNVVTDRYRQQLSTYTEVLDAENRRVQSYYNFYNAIYDESLAGFRLRRAVGDL